METVNGNDTSDEILLLIMSMSCKSTSLLETRSQKIRQKWMKIFKKGSSFIHILDILNFLTILMIVKFLENCFYNSFKLG